MEETWTLKRCGNFSCGSSEIKLDSRNVVVGRNVEKRYRVDSVNVSRQHACFNLTDDGVWAVQDLRSRNGVYVNGVKIRPSITVYLAENDTIGFGRPSPISDDIFVYRLCKDEPPLRKQEASGNTQDVGALDNVRHTRTQPPDIVEIIDDDSDDAIITEVIPPKRRHRAHSNLEKADQRRGSGASSLPCTIKSEPLVVKTEHSGCKTTGAIILPASNEAKTESASLSSRELPKLAMCSSSSSNETCIKVKTEMSSTTALQSSVKHEPQELLTSVVTEARSIGLTLQLKCENTSCPPKDNVQVSVKEESESGPSGIEIAQKSVSPSPCLSSSNLPLLKDCSVKHEVPPVQKIEDRVEAPKCTTATDTACTTVQYEQSSSPKRSSPRTQTNSLLKNCFVVIQRLDQMFIASPSCTALKPGTSRNNSAQSILKEHHAQSETVEHNDVNNTASGVSHNISTVVCDQQSCADDKASLASSFSLNLGPEVKSEAGDPSRRAVKEESDFSQNDLVIVLSDDDDEHVAPLSVKCEPEDYDDHICHQNEDEDDLWIVHESFVKVKKEVEDEPVSAGALPSDTELLNSLVWNASSPDSSEEDEASSLHLSDGGKLPPESSKHEEQTSEHDVSDFFPVLSQNFYSDAEKDSEKKKKRDESTNLPIPSGPSRHSRVKLIEPLALPKLRHGSKKASLKDKVQKSMHHRVPMPGGGSAVQLKEGCAKSNASQKGAGEKPAEKSKLFYQVNRFPSRTIHLLDVGESIAMADMCKNKPKSRGIKAVQGEVSKAVERRVDILCGARSAAGPGKLSDSKPDAQGSKPARTVPMAVPVTLEKMQPTPVKPQQPHGFQPDISDEPPPKRQKVDAEPAMVEHVGNTVSAEMIGKLPALQGDRPKTVRFSSESLTELRTEEERAEFAERARAGLKMRKLVKKVPKCNITTFIGYMLGWKVQWLKEQLNSNKIPPLIDMSKVREKRLMYSSLEEYVFMHYNFLCLEGWYQVFQNWRDYFSKTSKMTFNVAVTEHSLAHRTENAVESISQLTCCLAVKQEAVKKGAYPLEGHFVRIDLRVQDNERVVVPVFGFIVQNKLNRSVYPTKSALHPIIQGDHTDDCHVEIIKVHIKARRYPINLSKAMRLVVVSKVSPLLRQVEAILELDRSPFMQSIIRPNPHHFWSRKGALNPAVESRYNKDQAGVISSALLAMKSPGKETRIVILHGPPGTGKTRTLLGIVQEIIRNCENQRLLVVAPSNTAVDEIGRRLLIARAEQSRAGEPVDSLLKIVRVGQEHMIHADVRGIWLEELVQKNIQKELREKTQEFDHEIRTKQAQVSQCQQKIESLKSCTYPDFRNIRRAEFEIRHLQTEILRLTEKRRTFVDEATKQNRNHYERKIVLLQKAHIVLSTINSCRSRLLEEAFGRNSSHSFTCVIADEATQCTEVELLLALQYRANRLILVGDPHQLPATVLSREAVEFNFQQSLFERFYSYLKQSANSQPIFLLKEQCRMHSEICSFPSRYFYEGKLWPTRELDASYASFPLIPYLVFNVANSPEITEGSTSWMNHGEAQFVALLCGVIADVCGSGASVGVITPYQAQKNLISAKLGANSRADVNTIDGFQGQERDVVVLSCVRAYHPKGSIGFVADARRLNVAITRARKALFICGHLQSLEDSAEWAALIQDGVTRNKVRMVLPDTSHAATLRVITKQDVYSWRGCTS